ncbi:MAG: DPP IV N-terminal domain-containing protein, partial [Gemmataceae bacterium]|nr:DPP IV N-terminal domain-containing protein [Gemmataceae bacterium]MBJ7496475.1 DPP IV N-terminal domain-containing protein [Gemmataceae bacterium]
MKTFRVIPVSFLLLLMIELFAFELYAQAVKVDPGILTVDRIFNSKEFSLESAPATRWRKNGAVSISLESGDKGQKLVSHDLNTGMQETIVPEHWLIPQGETKPLNVEDYEFSGNDSKMLIYTNSKKVWRVNSRGDYWVLDLSNRELKKLGGDFLPSTLMFATFSPDAKRVCFVHKNNLYVQDLLDFN